MKIKINDNLEMRLRNVDDAEEVFKTIDINREYLREWLGWVDKTVSIDDTKKNISSNIEELQKGTDVVLGIFKNNKYVGNIGLHSIKSPDNSGMIGYWISENEQGKGIVTNCVKAMIDYGFDKLNLNRIYIYCADQNKKSKAVPERLDFQKEGVIRDGEYINGKYYDKLVYGMLRREWGFITNSGGK